MIAMAFGFLAAPAGGVLRAAQVLLECAPHLLVGFLAAGWIRAAGAGAARRLLGESGPSGAARLVGWGILLPLDALGAIPTLLALGRAGAPLGRLLAFGLVAPLWNPISIAFAMGRMSPLDLAILMALTIGGGLATAEVLSRIAGAGGLAGGMDPGDGEGNRAAGTIGGGGLFPTLDEAARAAGEGRAWAWIGLALVGPFLLGAAFPHSWLDDNTARDQWWAPFRVGVVAFPFVLSPEQVVPLLAQNIDKAGSSGGGALWSLWGVGMSLALIPLGYAIAAERGEGNVRIRSRAAFGFAGAFALGLGLAWATHFGLPTLSEEYDYNHVYDQFVSVFPPNAGLGTIRHQAEKILGVGPEGRATVSGYLAVGLLALMAGVGAWRRGKPALAVGTGGAAEGRGDDPGSASGGSGNARGVGVWNAAIPPGVLRALAALAVPPAALVGLMTYFPPTPTLFQEMVIVRAEAFSANGDALRSDRLRHLDSLARLAGKVEFSRRLRLLGFDGRAAETRDRLLEQIAKARAETLAKDDEAVSTTMRELMRAFAEFREAADPALGGGK